MAICPECGRESKPEAEYCPYCNHSLIIEGEILKETTESVTPDVRLFDQDNTVFGQSTNTEESGLNTFLKVLIIILVFVIPGVGPLVGLIGGVFLMASPLESNRSFGKLLVWTGVIMMILSFLCCCMNFFFGFFTFLIW